MYVKCMTFYVDEKIKFTTVIDSHVGNKVIP